MPTFSVIQPDQTNGLPSARSHSKLSERMDEYEMAIKSCPVNGVISIPITGEDGQSARSEALRISRAATRQDIIVETWSAVQDGKTTVYCKRLDGSKSAFLAANPPKVKASKNGAKASKAKAEKAEKPAEPVTQ